LIEDKLIELEYLERRVFMILEAIDVKELLQEKAGYILSFLMGNGGEYGEIFFEDSSNTRIVFENNKVDKIEHGSDVGVGLRLIKNHKVYYGYSTEFDINSLVELAKTIANTSSQGPIKVGKAYAKAYMPIGIDPEQIELSKKIEILNRANDAARSFGEYVKQVSAVLMDKKRQIMIINSLGEHVEDIQTRTVFYTEVVSYKDGILQRGYESMGGNVGFELFERKSPEEIASIAARRAIMLLDAKPAPAGSFTIVMSSEAGGTMVHEAVGHGLEADLVQQGQSVYKDKIGQKVASSLVSVIDDATIPGMNGSFNFDDEGVEAQRKVLIEDGYLVGYMYDRLRAMKDGVKSTGNGRRQSYAHPPVVRMTNTFIKSGKTNPEDIIKDTKKGILVKKMGGGQVNTITGDFVFDVMEGYIIENGQITYPIRGATLIGNGPKALEDIDAVGYDEGFAIGTCGKDGQGVPVSDAQPTVRIKSMTLGGCEVCSG
jgi:microcin-processing peptidase 2. Unknown type peptidase. MEROPS family U62